MFSKTVPRYLTGKTRINLKSDKSKFYLVVQNYKTIIMSSSQKKRQPPQIISTTKYENQDKFRRWAAPVFAGTRRLVYQLLKKTLQITN